MSSELLQIGELQFRRYLGREKMEEACERIATSIEASLKKDRVPLFLCMLNGAFVFAADLLRRIPSTLEVEFIRYATYDRLDASQTPKQILGLTRSVSGREVIVVEDIVDTGITMRALRRDLLALGATTVRIATMFFKPEAFLENYELDFVGIDLPNRFVVGYGLDYDGFGRNLPDLYILDQ